jgi:hypothetical protein
MENSNPAQQYQYQYDHDYQADTASEIRAASIKTSAAIAAETAKQGDDEDNQEYGAQGHGVLLSRQLLHETTSSVCAFLLSAPAG